MLVLSAILAPPILVSLGAYALLKAGNDLMCRLGFGAIAILAGISVLAFVMTLLLWIRSYQRNDEVDFWWVRQGHCLVARSSLGRIRLDQRFGNIEAYSTFSLDHYCTPSAKSLDVFDEECSVVQARLLPVCFHIGGFAMLAIDLTHWRLMFPHGFPVALLGGASLLLIRYQRFLRSRYRMALGLCRRCGYQLTGNTSGSCPECGAQVPGRVESIADRAATK